jgi:protein tyrosine/serine phosphatase
MPKRRLINIEHAALLASGLVLFATCVLASKGSGQKQRDPRWASAIELRGVKNFFRVSDDLYRGAQPTEEGFRGLEKLGIKTVINLRALHSDEKKLRGRNLSYARIRFAIWHPEHEDVVRFLKIVTDPARTPVFVHCQRGADRTGMIVAIYRICVQGWSKADAIEEMTRGGYGFASTWRHLVRYIRKFDVERLKRDAGFSKALASPTPIAVGREDSLPAITPAPVLVAP